MNIEIESQYELDYRRIEKAILFLRAAQRNQPSLRDVADHVGLSEYHFQRLFSRWAGISPKSFLQFLTLGHAKTLLEDTDQSVLQAALGAGLSGGARLHDLFVHLEAMTPGEYKRGGSDLVIRYGFHPTPFGLGMICTTEKGICGLTFSEGEDREESIAYQQRRWPLSHFTEDDGATVEYIRRIFHRTHDSPVTCLLKGTEFQCQVWQALLSIPPGKVTSYSSIARSVGRPGSARAAANAVGANPIAYLIPCHRVIRGTGALGGYRWGTGRKQAMLARESAS
jgi:AraC family transcriptional regulator, regulatory protein of adaptative response / methylated-DNA-[protein]-cysteine methyltransferase